MTEAQIDEYTPVAKPVKPGPERREEAVKEIDNPSPLHTTAGNLTGGNLADTEGENDEATYTVTPTKNLVVTPPPKNQRSERRRN